VTLASGARLGVYEIVAPIGAGGMGEVYRATDSRLKRQVAIKVLPPGVAMDAGRLARFQREAELLAQLNHPHIAHIYGLEGLDGAEAREPFIVMELVEGETLADRLHRKPFTIAEALTIARQIADALQAAHDRGIVHRDLKPANIKLTHDGTVKVLDFGLAKAAGADEASAPALTQSPTFASPAMTQSGIILGTAAYMSPEQARGAVVDRGADLWAFGVVLMEMLTGAAPFAGATLSDVIAAVLVRDIPWNALPPETPSSIRRLLRRCLERDRKKRLADAGAAVLEIDEAVSGVSDVPREPHAPRPHTSAPTFLRVVVPTAVAASLLAGGLVWRIARPAASPASRVVLSIMPPEGVLLNEAGTMSSPPIIAPDGSAVMFASRSARSLFVRRLDSIDAVKIPQAATNEPFWHGSSRITIPVSDGTARKLLEVVLPDGAPETVARYTANVRGGSWSAKGDVLLGGDPPLTWDTRDILKRISPGARATSALYPQFFGDGDDFLALFGTGDDDAEVGIGTLRSGQIADVKPLFKNDTAASYTPADGGRLLFVRNDNLYSQRFNRAARALDGEPELLVRGVASQPVLYRADFSVAENGAIAWRPGHAGLSQVIVYDRRGARVTTAGPARPVTTIALAPAGDRLLVDDLPPSLVTVGDDAREKLPGDASWYQWLPDGRLIGERHGELVALRTDARSVERLGQLPDQPAGILALSPDGQFVVARAGGRAAWSRVNSMSSATAWTPLSLNDAVQADVSFSPDGRWILYDEDNRVYAQPFPGPGLRHVVAPSGVDPVWRRDGREIVFLDGDSIFSTAVGGGGSAVTFGAPVRLFGGVRRAHGAVQQSSGLAISADGSRLFIVEGLEQPKSNVIHVMIPAAKQR
jgi:serine/threonine protein kinase/Tol biopolymer transport system component